MQVENNDYVKNQCSLVVRVDGNEIEIPVTFGMTSDEIRMVYPFLASILNNKIENPAMQFSRSKERGEFADLTEEEYNAELQRVVAQSQYWYEKPEAGLLDVAIRFALDIKMKGISDLQNVFSSTPAYRPFKLRPVTEEEASVIMRRLKLDDDIPAEDLPDAGDINVEDDLSDIRTETQADTDDNDIESEADADADDNISEAMSESDDIASDDNTMQLDPKSVDDLLNDAFGVTQISDEQVVESFEETMRKDLENVDASRYQTEYKPTELSDEQIKDGMLVREDDNAAPVSVVDTSSDEYGEYEDDGEELPDSDYDEVPDDDDELDGNVADFGGEE